MRGDSKIETATVALATYRRPKSLALLLEGLARQDDVPLPWNVVIVDNEPPPGSESVVTAARTTMSAPVSYFREPRRGSAHARNRALHEAEGDVVVITDDDVVPRSTWLRHLLAPIVAGRCDGTAGRVVLDPKVARPRWFADDRLGGYLTAHHPASVERPFEPGDYMVTANCALRADILRGAGGFSPLLGPRGRVQITNDDVLLGRRFQAAGGRLHHVPAAVVVHELPPERLAFTYLLRRAYTQGRSDWIIDEPELRRLRWRGLGVALRWWRAALRQRLPEGPHRAHVAAHLACDLARGAGLLREWATPDRDGHQPAGQRTR